MILSLWLAFVGATALILAIPGPTSALVLARADRPKQERYALVCGLAVGDMIAMTFSIAGLATVLSLSALAFQTLKLAGGAYLVYLGIQTMRSRARPFSIDSTSRAGALPSRNSMGPFAVGIFTGLLHPKTYLLFTAFLPVFINPEACVLPQYITLVFTWGALSLGGAMLWTSLGQVLRMWLHNHNAYSIISKLSGFILMIFGLSLLTLRRTD